MMLLIIIVYVGAIIILIGYICAVCPNFVVESFNKGLFLIVSLSLMNLRFYFISSLNFSKSNTISDYFFSS